MSLYKQYKTDKQAEVDGIWVDYGVNEDDSKIRFKISRMSKANKKYQKALERATRPHRRAIELETMDETLAENIFMGVFCDTVLLDWENVRTEDGENMTFNKENAIKLFTDLPELYDDLQDKAKKAALFREEAIEEEAKN